MLEHPANTCLTLYEKIPTTGAVVGNIHQPGTNEKESSEDCRNNS